MNDEMEQRAEAERDADPRVDLAVERTELALERTHLAWIRTMLTIITAGLAIDKGFEIIHHQRLLNNQAWAENGHITGVTITSAGTILMLLETIQFIRRSRQLAAMRKSKTTIFSTNVILAILVTILGLALIYFMIITG